VGFLREGMVVDIIDDAGTTRHNLDIEIKEVDWVARAVTFEASVAAAVDDNDRIFIADSQANTGALVNKEPIGLEGSLLASGTYLGVSRTDFPNWRASALAANGLFDQDILLRARQRVQQESGISVSAMAKSFRCLTHQTQVSTLFKLAIPQIRYTGNELFDLGYSEGVKFGNIGFVTSDQCPTNTAYMGDWQYSQALYTPGGRLHIDTEYNGAQLKWVPTKDQGLVFMKEYCAFVVKRPNAFVRISALTDATR
jgi:hypothetical protein